MDEPWLKGKKILLLEPRRLAARSVAMRMAELLHESVGEQVGYRVRFESRVSTRTQIEAVTEGILLRMLQRDASMEGVGLLIFDEFHERSLMADVALALALQVQEVLRPDLKLLLMSATLNGEDLASHLGNIPVLTSEGRQYPVDVKYIEAEPNAALHQWVGKRILSVLRDHTGDVLVFLPGTSDIRKTQAFLEELSVPAVVHPLYGDLPFEKQKQAIQPDAYGQRKVVLATSIAETSLTIEGITVVVDCGYSRVPSFDPRSGLTRLETKRVTRDSADQRAGRAGRLAPGTCYRLWKESTHQHLLATRVPEILESDLSPVLLELLSWGIADVHELRWITPPPAGALEQANSVLALLGACTERKITERGKRMALLPTHPRLAHVLTCDEMNTPDFALLAIDVLCLLEERDPLSWQSGADLSLRVECLQTHRSGKRTAGDRSALDRILRLARSWQQTLQVNERAYEIAPGALGRIVAQAYPDRIAKRMEKHTERYKLTSGRVVRLPEHDPLKTEEWLAIAQLDSGVGEGKVFLAAPLAEQDLAALAQPVTDVRWNTEREAVEGVEERRVGSLVVSKKVLTEIADRDRVRVICEVIQHEGLSFLGWTEVCTEWCNRVMWLRHKRPEENWPDVSETHLLDTVTDWLPPFIPGVYKRAALQRLDWSSLLSGLLPWDLHKTLNELTPPRIEVPSGSMIRVHYPASGDTPTVEVRLQECFGLLETPVVNAGKTPVKMHLLSPGYKPVQVTQDLKSFWRTTYHEVRKELRRRYPKHSWPEDPFTATAVRGVPRRR
jgi:ATP-dependent helicase HrpB